MKILALETSTALGGAALIVDGKILAEETSRKQRSHSELLHSFIQNILKKTGITLEQIDAFAVGRGPGSFTGIRVAANAGMTFAQTFNKPLVAIDSITQLASQVESNKTPVLILMNAFKNMLYYGLCDISGSEVKFLESPGAMTLPEIQSHFARTDCFVVGDGWSLVQQAGPLPASWKREQNPHDEPTPSALGILATKYLAEPGRVFDWRAFSPLYIRASEAEEKARERVFNSDVKDPKHGKGV